MHTRDTTQPSIEFNLKGFNRVVSEIEVMKKELANLLAKFIRWYLSPLIRVLHVLK